MAAPICQQNPLLGFPASGTAYAGCGGYVTESVGSIAPGICRAQGINLIKLVLYFTVGSFTASFFIFVFSKQVREIFFAKDMFNNQSLKQLIH